MSYFETFRKEIVKRSEADNYDDAITEWVYMGEAFDEISSCLCGHGIKDNRVVHNTINKNKVIVGNCCIEKFGIERKSYNKSKLAFVDFAIQVNTNRILDSWLRQALRPKIEHGGRFNKEDLRLLKKITGVKSRFKAVDASEFDF